MLRETYQGSSAVVRRCLRVRTAGSVEKTLRIELRASPTGLRTARCTQRPPGISHWFIGCPETLSRSTSILISLRPGALRAPSCMVFVSLGFACRALIARQCPGAPEKVRCIGCRFKRPLYPGTAIKLKETSVNLRQSPLPGSPNCRSGDSWYTRSAGGSTAKARCGLPS